MRIWRCDCVLIQKWPDNSICSLILLNSWLVSQLQIILSVKDSFWIDDKNKSVEYTDTLIKLFQPLNKDHAHSVHEIIELCDWSELLFKNSQFIEDQQSHAMSTILWSIYVVSASVSETSTDKSHKYYLNNFIDWDLYNSIYEKNFLDHDIKTALFYSLWNTYVNTVIILCIA